MITFQIIHRITLKVDFELEATFLTQPNTLYKYTSYAYLPQSFSHFRVKNDRSNSLTLFFKRVQRLNSTSSTNTLKSVQSLGFGKVNSSVFTRNSINLSLCGYVSLTRHQLFPTQRDS